MNPRSDGPSAAASIRQPPRARQGTLEALSMPQSHPTQLHTFLPKGHDGMELVRQGSEDAESGKREVPGFVSKLFRMVNDPTSGLIRWDPSGLTFTVSRPEEFSRQVLPLFFKHNNFSSFVRQLNMYGFHKVPQPQSGSMVSTLASHADHQRSTAGNFAAIDPSWQFSNPNFIRDRPDLLSSIKRKIPREETQADSNAPAAGSYSTPNISSEFQNIKQQQEALRADLQAVQRDSQLLWNETIAARDRYNNQQQVIDKILRFLASVFSSEKSITGQYSNNKRQRMIEYNDPDFRQQVLELMQPSPNASPFANIDINQARSRIDDLDQTAGAIAHDIDFLPDNFDFANHLGSFDPNAFDFDDMGILGTDPRLNEDVDRSSSNPATSLASSRQPAKSPAFDDYIADFLQEQPPDDDSTSEKTSKNA